MTDFSHCQYDYIILGAGPAGLSFATELLNRGTDSFLILEQELFAGGLCRSVVVDGSPLDIGGCHLLDARNKEVCDFIFSYLPQESWKLHRRVNTIQIKDRTIGFPLENHIWELPEVLKDRYMASLREASRRRGAQPTNFRDWIIWHFGKEIAEDYMLPYNQKIWSFDLTELGTYWLSKLPPITYEDIERSLIEKKSPEIFAAHNTFYYPYRHAFGDVFSKMAEKISDHIIYNYKVRVIDAEQCSVDNRFFGKHIINTIPWTSIEYLNVPEKLLNEIDLLKYSSIDIDYFQDLIKTQSQAIYCPDMEKPYHRVILRYNYNKTWRGYWTETNSKRASIAGKGSFHYRNEYAYPLNTLEKPKAIKSILNWFSERNIIGLGRWGEWEHYNGDVVIAKGRNLANKLIVEKAN